MKSILKSMLLLSAAYVLSACTESPEPGVVEESYDGPTYGVYFPSQDNTGDQELDPAEATELTFKARRVDANGAINVPFEVEENIEGIFNVSPIRFDDGQEETTFTVTFPSAEVGTTYECAIVVTDPSYIDRFSKNAAGVDFSVTRVKWNKLVGANGETTGTWTDHWFEAIFSGDHAESHPEVYERDDRKGYYRFVKPYDKGLVDGIFGGDGYFEYWGCTGGSDFYIDATDPDYVFMEVGSTGVDVNGGSSSAYGNTRIGSFVPENFNGVSASQAIYGTISEGVIVFPEGGIIGSMANYNNGSFSTSFCNDDEWKILLPGAKDFDFTFSISSDEPADGNIDIYFDFGADVKKIKYAFYEGALSEAIAESNARGLAEGYMAADGELTESGVLSASFEQTGMYTVVAVSFDDKGAARESDYHVFGFITADEEVPVVANMGIEVTDRNTPKGYTSENSFEYWAYGENIARGSWAVFKSDDIAGIPAAVIRAFVEEEGKPFTEAQIEAINGTGLTMIVPGLSSGTYYTMAVVLNNGYVGALTMMEALTNGDPHPLNASYTINDLYLSDKETWFRSWNMWAVDYFDETVTRRQNLATWTFSENTVDDDEEEEFDAINLDGLSMGYVKNDRQVWEYYNGAVYQCNAGTLLGTYGPYYLSTLILDENTMKLYTGSYAMIGGLAADGYMAFVSAQSAYAFNGIAIYAYNDATLSSSLGALELFTDIMLEDPAVAAANSAAPAAVTAKTAQLHKLAAEMAATPLNCVELQGRARIHALIDEMNADRGSKLVNRATKSVEGGQPIVRKAAAKTSFEAGKKLTAGAGRTFTVNPRIKPGQEL